jgi:hypothetical protein
MATRIKASAMRRRVKRRGERASYKKKANATMLRSRKQRGRKTARVARKVMRGGVGEPIQIYIANSQGKVFDTSVPAVTLTFSDMILSKNKKLVLEINIDKYPGSVRELLHHLFSIDDIKRYNIYSIGKFLMGLADGLARRKTIERAKKYTEINCPTALPKITELSNKILSSTTCQLDIELSEKDGNIEFTVKKYHRMKFGTITCVETKEVMDCKWDSEDQTEYDCKPKEITVTTEIKPFYPILDFDTSDPLSGIDYIDYETTTSKSSIILKKGQKPNLFTFTVKGKTIDDLIKGLTDTKQIMLDEKNEITTVENEERKAAYARDMEMRQMEKEAEKERVKKEEEEEKILKKQKEKEEFEKLTPQQQAVILEQRANKEAYEDTLARPD